MDKFFIHLVLLLLSNEAFLYWAWEMTPLPIGAPSAKQYLSALGLFWYELRH